MAWGFFDSIFEQKEYGEPYVLEKLAREMMAKDPKLKEEFERKIESDPQFAANPYARLSLLLRPLALVRGESCRRISGGTVDEAGWRAAGEVTRLLLCAVFVLSGEKRLGVL